MAHSETPPPPTARNAMPHAPFALPPASMPAPPALPTSSSMEPPVSPNVPPENTITQEFAPLAWTAVLIATTQPLAIPALANSPYKETTNASKAARLDTTTTRESVHNATKLALPVPEMEMTLVVDVTKDGYWLVLMFVNLDVPLLNI